MPMSAAEIEQMIKEAIPEAVVQISDLRGDGDHYAALVTASWVAGRLGLPSRCR